ncbi:MAG: glycoside hydrolase family 3 N-terminal domain-containing protein, partial [Bacteroidales bacterium]
MRVISSIILLFTFYASTVPGSFAQQNQVFSDKPYISTSQQKVWVDSVFNTLSMDEQIAQLLMIRTYSNKNREYYDSISRLIMKYNIGGLTFFQGSPQQQAELTNHWQRVAKTPLLVSIDAEWGLGMRLDSVMDFPEQMTLGAIQDNELIYKMGYQIGEQCRR